MSKGTVSSSRLAVSWLWYRAAGIEPWVGDRVSWETGDQHAAMRRRR